MIAVTVHFATAESMTLRSALDPHPIWQHFALNAHRLQSLSHDSDAIALLDPQLLSPGHQRLAFRASGRDKQSRKLINGERDQMFGHMNAFQTRRRDLNVSHGFSPGRPMVCHAQVRAHERQNVEHASAGRVDSYTFDREPRAS